MFLLSVMVYGVNLLKREHHVVLSSAIVLLAFVTGVGLVDPRTLLRR